MGLGFREGTSVEDWFTIGDNTRAFGFSGDWRRDFDWNLGSRLQKIKESNCKLDDAL